ncbi:MAG: SpoIIE family protein phosphatase [Spirochaetales bacterium]|nr:SpoIIE family protein phosphatase [Spirochaetales bacterium]
MIAVTERESTEKVTQRVLGSTDPDTQKHQRISRIASEYCFAPRTAHILDVADELQALGALAAGVVDEDGTTAGIVESRELTALLSRPFARDVMRNHTISDIIKAVRTFSANENIFNIAEQITDDLKGNSTVFYLLADESGAFRGIFSSRDMLIYLSGVTQEDIGLARKLQSRLVREKDLVCGNTFEIASSSMTAKGVGGDFYHIRTVGDDRWLISMGDVAGKGIAASIVTSVIAGVLDMFDFKNGLSLFIKKLNSYIYTTFESEKFVTSVFLEYDERIRSMRVCDAGHSHVFVFRDNRLMRLSTAARNLPLGIIPALDPVFSRFTPREDDILLVITDGLIEQENGNGQVYSMNRVRDILERHRESAVETIRDQLIKDFHRFRGAHHLTDDITFAVMKFNDQKVVL